MDQTFLAANYPLMVESAKFLLNYATLTAGVLHTVRANAHESDWDSTDPTTNIAAMKTLFPAVIAAAKVLGLNDSTHDGALVTALTTAIPELPAWPKTTVNSATVIARTTSSAPGNVGNAAGENIGLEPVWPYGAITDTSTDAQLAKDTFANRPFPDSYIWSPDAIQAARLGLTSDFQTAMSAQVASFQVYPSGLGTLQGGSSATDPYDLPDVESGGVMTTALQEALVQNVSGTLEIAPAWPAVWDTDASVSVPGALVDVQTRGGTPTTVIVQANSTQTLHVKNPWPGQSVQVLDESASGAVVVSGTSSATFDLALTTAHNYDIERVATALPTTQQQVTNAAATAPRTLGTRTIGINAVPTVASTGDLALNGTATQSSTYGGSTITPSANLAIDGNTDGVFSDGSVTSTNSELNAWWQVDLGTVQALSSIGAWNRSDPAASSRTTDYWVFASAVGGVNPSKQDQPKVASRTLPAQ